MRFLNFLRKNYKFLLFFIVLALWAAIPSFAREKFYTGSYTRQGNYIEIDDIRDIHHIVDNVSKMCLFKYDFKKRFVEKIEFKFKGNCNDFGNSLSQYDLQIDKDSTEIRKITIFNKK